MQWRISCSFIFANSTCSVSFPTKTKLSFYRLVFTNGKTFLRFAFHSNTVRLLKLYQNKVNGFRFKFTKKKVKNSIFQLNIFVFCNFCSFIFLSHWSALNPGTRCLNVADELLTRGQCFFLLVLPQS